MAEFGLAERKMSATNWVVLSEWLEQYNVKHWPTVGQGKLFDAARSSMLLARLETFKLKAANTKCHLLVMSTMQILNCAPRFCSSIVLSGCALIMRY